MDDLYEINMLTQSKTIVEEGHSLMTITGIATRYCYEVLLPVVDTKYCYKNQGNVRRSLLTVGCG